MKYVWIILSSSLLFSHNMFEIRDAKGHLLHKRTLHHTQTDAYLTQKESQYSLQALYNELKQAENQARKAHLIHQKASKISNTIKQARTSGKQYTLTPSQRQILIEDAKYFKGG